MPFIIMIFGRILLKFKTSGVDVVKMKKDVDELVAVPNTRKNLWKNYGKKTRP